MRRETTEVPAGLRRWFVIHFWADIVVAVPLFVAPTAFLGALGWTAVDPAAARVAAAALFGIGIESLLRRDASAPVFRAMLELKCIWSGASVLGLALSAAQGGPPATWGFVAVFLTFTSVWNYYRITMKRATPAARAAVAA